MLVLPQLMAARGANGRRIVAQICYDDNLNPALLNGFWGDWVAWPLRLGWQPATQLKLKSSLPNLHPPLPSYGQQW